MKKLVAFVLILILSVGTAACDAERKSDLQEDTPNGAFGNLWSLLTAEEDRIAETEGIREYKTDYIEKYRATLNAMFENAWTLLYREDKYIEHVPICEHVDTRPQQYIEWAIEYHDGNGERRTFVFDNRSSLSIQIETYVTHYIADYYEKTFYAACTEGMPLAPSSYVFGFMAKASVDMNLPENKQWKTKTDTYKKLLETPEGAICLAKLTPTNIFEMCPLYLSIHISFTGHPDDKQRFEEDAMEKIEGMLADMNAFTDNRLNVSVSLGYHEIINLHIGTRQYRWYIIQGKQIYDIDPFYYEKPVLESYAGIFW
ncbi:MAG: hypothetical protein FWF10_05430 [Clostridiales bacterium]|nr:hypothetical protein [Clostridiales bacterium]